MAVVRQTVHAPEVGERQSGRSKQRAVALPASCRAPAGCTLFAGLQVWVCHAGCWDEASRGRTATVCTPGQLPEGAHRNVQPFMSMHAAAPRASRPMQAQGAIEPGPQAGPWATT